MLCYAMICYDILCYGMVCFVLCMYVCMYVCMHVCCRYIYVLVEVFLLHITKVYPKTESLMSFMSHSFKTRSLKS